MKKCELCKGKARMYCESDQASLCWDCDAKVHSANFLVARHSRNLLCHVCQSPTPWSASGGKLGPTVSICEQCVDRGICDESGEEESESESEELVEVVEENQVVPWSPPPQAESSSSVEESVSDEDVVVSRKRSRIDDDSEDAQSYTSSYRNICSPPPSDSAAEAEVTSSRKKFQNIESGRVEVFESGILDSLRRFHREETDPGEKMTKLSASPGPSI